MEILHESPRYIVRAVRGNDKAGVIVASFSGVNASEASAGIFFGHALAVKLDLPWVGIVAVDNDWYRHAEFDEAITIVRDWIRRRAIEMDEQCPELIGYGVSMGGYAAIKSSAFLNLDYVYAMAPQWSVDPAEVSYKSHFQGFYRPEMVGMGIRQQDVKGSIYVLLDPYETPDVREFEQIRRVCDATAIHVCRGGHMVTERMKGTRAFTRLLAARHVPGDVRRDASEINRASAERIQWVIHRAHGKRPVSLGAALLGRFDRDTVVAARVVEREWPTLLKLYGALLDAGKAELGRRLLTYVVGSHQPIVPLTYVTTWMGELLFYDPEAKAFSATRRHLPQNGVPVIVHEGVVGALRPAGFDPLPLKPEQDGSAFFLHDGQGFLSARPGSLIATVGRSQAWERFHFVMPPRVEKFSGWRKLMNFLKRRG